MPTSSGVFFSAQIMVLAYMAELYMRLSLLYQVRLHCKIQYFCENGWILYNLCCYLTGLRCL